MLALSQLAEILPQVAQIAEKAGAAILEVYETADVGQSLKADASPVTHADLAADRLIVAALAELMPGMPIISEESPQSTWAVRRGWTEHWLVDPLDGTKEFLARNGEFTVNIALVQQHVARLGVVHLPVAGTTYRGLVGSGAWRSKSGDAQQRIQAESTCCARPRVLASRSHRNAALEALLATLRKDLGDYELLTAGSSLKFCRLAEGEADLYPRLGPTSEWDTAAGQAVLEAAGGYVVTLAGEPLRYNSGDSFLNPHFLAYADASRGWLSLVNNDDG